MTQQQTLALVGAVGGAGTTTLAVETGAILARTGRDVAVLDAAFATGGLANYVRGRIDTDITAVVAEDAELAAALAPIEAELPGALDAAPAAGPFERLARAKTAGAAERFERQIAAAALTYDVVLVDTPPIAANQAVAAVSACRRVGVVTPDTARGADGLARARGRLADVGSQTDVIAATHAREDRVIEEAAAAIPAPSGSAAGESPACVDDESPLGPPVAAFCEAALGIEVGLDFEESGRFERLLGSD